MAITRLLVPVLLALALSGCGSKEDPSLTAPAPAPTAGAAKGPGVTKPSNVAVDPGSQEAVTKEEKGG